MCDSFAGVRACGAGGSIKPSVTPEAERWVTKHKQQASPRERATGLINALPPMTWAWDTDATTNPTQRSVSLHAGLYATACFAS